MYYKLLFYIGCFCSLNIVKLAKCIIVAKCFKVVVGLMPMFLLDELSVLDLVVHINCCILRQSYGKTLSEEAYFVVVSIGWPSPCG